MRLSLVVVALICVWRVSGEDAVWPPPYMTIPSEEVDSSEHGGPPGRVPTTCPCGAANKGMARIVSGKETNVNEFPSMAMLVRVGGKKPFCGGSLITLMHVLTAAHCLVKKPATHITIALGVHDYTKESPHAQWINVREIVIHEGYEEYKHLDIALVVLETPAKLNRYVGLVCLPSRPLNLDRQYLTGIGWGRIGWHKEEGQSPFLKKMRVRAVPLAECAPYAAVNLTDPHQLCTYGSKRGLSQGDSGGALLWLDPDTNRYTLVGIPSFVYPFLSENYKPDVTADVSSFLPWIHRQLKRTEPSNPACHSTQ